MIAALAFLLGYERVEEEDDSEASSSDDETSQQPQIVISKEAVYKVLYVVLYNYVLCCIHLLTSCPYLFFTIMPFVAFIFVKVALFHKSS